MKYWMYRAMISLFLFSALASMPSLCKANEVQAVNDRIDVNSVEVADRSTSEYGSVHSNFITVTLDQIYLTNEGMFVHIDRDFIPVNSLHSVLGGQYRCAIHNRIDYLITCCYCGFVYDRLQHRRCPNRQCQSRNRMRTSR